MSENFRILIVLLVFLTGCGPSEEEIRRQEIERKEELKQQEQMRIIKAQDKIIFELENSLSDNDAKIGRRLTNVSVDYYDIEYNSYGFIVEVSFRAKLADSIGKKFSIWKLN